ncbi:hypothetical protein OUZ56_013581 [Daphnia magna]|uniref:Uncharacterized protein n=1 Tax=Daphnia magna TaxID=35525 RepID=A0ABQ9Z6D7_9CRUS|nr:hypothetical protein OUZ56_013581 [Daphnia magna]
MEISQKLCAIPAAIFQDCGGYSRLPIKPAQPTHFSKYSDRPWATIFWRRSAGGSGKSEKNCEQGWERRSQQLALKD